MLDIRLKTVFDMLDKGMIVADIGSDHAFLPIDLVKSGKCPKAYACEVANGPLLSAINNIEKHGLIDKVIPIKSDGLENVPSDTQAIVIAGMGYYTVKKILEDNLSRLSSFKQIIIQVNLDVDLLRRWISEKHFTILNEVMVYKKHYYTIIEISTDYHERYSKEEILFGPILMKTKSDVFLNYLNHLLDKYNNIIKNTSNEKKELLNKKIETINKILNK